MKKSLFIALIATFALSACNKPADTDKADTAQVATPQTNNTPTPPEQHAHDHSDKHENDDKHEHGDDHDHDHHDHAHSAGDKYQCGDKSVQIMLHDHEGETEAHLIADNVEYDLSEDVQTKGRFTSDDSLQGDDKGMALILDGDKAKITTLDDKVILECAKATS